MLFPKSEIQSLGNSGSMDLQVGRRIGWGWDFPVYPPSFLHSLPHPVFPLHLKFLIYSCVEWAGVEQRAGEWNLESLNPVVDWWSQREACAQRKMSFKERPPSWPLVLYKCCRASVVEPGTLEDPIFSSSLFGSWVTCEGGVAYGGHLASRKEP